MKDTGDIKIVVLKGNLDTNTTPRAETELNELISAGQQKVLINFAELDYISSAGLRLLLATAKRLKAKGGALRVCSLNEMVQEVFDISGFGSILNVFDGEETALSDF